MAKRAAFLDRDGVITQEPPHYAHKVSQLAIIPRAAEAIRRFNESGFLVVVVSNQAGIARGYYREEDAEIFNKAMKDKLADNNAHIDAIYYCPHHPEATVEKYRVECDCRKPKAGMLILAQREMNIDLKQSFMIGDKMIDVEAGTRAGCRTILVRTGYGEDSSKQASLLKDTYVANDLYDAAIHILSLPCESSDRE